MKKNLRLEKSLWGKKQKYLQNFLFSFFYFRRDQTNSASSLKTTDGNSTFDRKATNLCDHLVE